VNRLKALDAAISRLDLALLRIGQLPEDPVAAHELAYCLDTLDRQDVPSGLGAELDHLLRQVKIIAGGLKLNIVVSSPWRLAPVDPNLPFETRASLRSKLLDIAASISVLQRD
jgi:hypothetical protein